MSDDEWYVLALDTETDGLPPGGEHRASRAVLDTGVERPERWPRVLQIAWVVLSRRGDIVARRNAYIQPIDMSPLNKHACAVHGISMELLKERGENGRVVLEELDVDMRRARLCAAHNAAFDFSMLAAEAQRRGLRPPMCGGDIFRRVCTMSVWEHKFRRRLRLRALYSRLYAEKKEFVSLLVPDGSYHDALVDAECAARCARRMCAMGLLSSPPTRTHT